MNDKLGRNGNNLYSEPVIINEISYYIYVKSITGMWKYLVFVSTKESTFVHTKQVFDMRTMLSLCETLHPWCAFKELDTLECCSGFT